MKNNDTQSTCPLRDTLLKRIEHEQLSPRPRAFFQGRECLVWSLWLLSVAVGAFAVAVSLFVMTYSQYELYEATHENFLTFFVEALPYIWFIVFGIMVYVAMYNLRHTKHGYRYPLWMILLSSVVLSLVAGSALQLFGFGYKVDSFLGQNLDMYMSQNKYEQKLWQVPGEGRLIGRQVLTTVKPAQVVVFEDLTGQRWQMDVSELMERDMQLLASGETVRLLGKSINNNLHSFHACGAFPWMLEEEVTLKAMSQERQTFIEQVHLHARKADERLSLLGGKTFASTSLPAQSVCANLAVVRRMPIPAQ